MSIATLAARISKADRRRRAARAALQPLRRAIDALLGFASKTRKIFYGAIDNPPEGAARGGKGASRRRRSRARLFESLLFGEAPRHSIVPRRHAAIEALEARELLTYNPQFSVNSGTVAEGGWITFNMVAKGFDPYSTVGWGSYNGSALAGTDFISQTGDFQVDGNGNGSKTVTIQTTQDGPTGSNPNDQSDGASVISFPFGGSGEGAGENLPNDILEEPTQPRFSTCNCGCGVVEASADRATGAAIVGDGLGAAPGAFSYNSYQRPHPIVDVLDTLSSTVSTATNIETQLTLQDLNGNTVWTGAPVYYSTAGYTQGQQVEFAGQIDATGLADGTYQRVMTITENYPNGQLPVIRTYGDWVGIENRDNSPYGSGWAPHNIDRLIPQTGGLATGASLEDGSGNVYWFQLDTNGNFDPPADTTQFTSLVKNGDGTYTLTKTDGTTEQFSSAGLLTKSTDRDGNWLQYGYNGDNTIASVQNEVGQTTAFAYSGGFLTGVTDFAGRVTSYVITNGQLTKITRPAPGDGEAQPVTTLGYDSGTGLLTTISDGDGTTTLSYNKFRAVTKIVSPDNTSTEYNTPFSQAIVDTSSGVGTQSNPAPLVYPSSIVGTTTDGNNHTSSYTVDPASGDVLTTIDAAGNKVSYQFNSTHEVTQITQPPLATGGQNLVTVQKYNASGDLIERDLPDGSVETWTIDPTWHEPTVYVDPAGRETDYTLDSTNGNVLTVTQVSKTQGLANRVTTYTYTPVPTGSEPPAGLVATEQDPRGITTAYSYTHHGQVSQIVYAQGTSDQATVSMTYDSNDNPASYVNELGATTLTTYDNLDRLVSTTLPAPDPNNPNVHPVYTQVWDARNRKISSTDALNLTTSYAYALGSDGDGPQLTKLTQPDPAGGTNYTVTTLAYDNADNLTSILDPMQRLTSMGYSANNLQTSVTLPNPVGGGSGGPQSTVVYNGLGMPVQEFDAANNETDNTFNYLGEVLTTTGPAPTQGGTRPTVTYTYNPDGQVLTKKDAIGNITQYVYNDFGELIQETLPDPDGSGPLASPVLKWSYDQDGNVVTYVDADNNSYSYSYDNRNNRTGEVEPSPDGVAPQPTWQWQFDKANELTETIDPMGRVYQRQWNADGWLTATIAPNLTTGGAGDSTTTTSYGYNLDGVRTTVTTPNGGTTTEKLDDLNRVVETDQPVPGVGQTAPVWKFTLDVDGETTQTLDPIGRTQTDTFDGMGRETNDVNFTGVNTAWAYNNLSEVTTVTVGTGTSAETTTNTWDNLGRKTKIQDALSGTTQMAYDLNGFMTSLTDSDNNTTTWTRDNLERVTAEKNQLGYSRTYAWDAANNLTQETDRDGRVRNFTVNHLNETTAEQWMNGTTVVNTISTAYNADGEVTSAGDSSSSYAFGYDGEGNLASVDNSGTPGVPHVALANQYDGQGDRTSLSATIAGVKDFLNSYSFDTLSRMTGITQQSQAGGNTVAPKTIDFTLDGIGDITQIYRMNYVGMGPNPQTDPADTALAHNTLGQLTGMTPSHNGTNIDPLSWTFDTLGRVATFGSSNGTATYGYNKDDELTSVTYTGTGQPPNESYSFDANGNQNETGHVVSPANQVTNDGTFTYAFDDEGNRTTRTRISSSYATDHTVSYSWDYRDRLTDVEYFDNNNVLTKHVHYVYGVFDHLIETEVDPTGGGSYTIVTHNVYDLGKPVVSPEDATQPVEPGLAITAAGNVVLQFNSSQLTERILNGPIASAYDAFFTALAQEDIPSGNTYWFLLNNEGSLIDIVDGNGNQVDHLVYTGFGSVFSESNAAIPHLIGYTGGLADAYTGLVNDWHRWYDPTAAVWLSVDPSGFRAGDFNQVRYTANQPVNRVDHSGLAPQPDSLVPSGQEAAEQTPDEQAPEKKAKKKGRFKVGKAQEQEEGIERAQERAIKNRKTRDIQCPEDWEGEKMPKDLPIKSKEKSKQRAKHERQRGIGEDGPEVLPFVAPPSPANNVPWWKSFFKNMGKGIKACPGGVFFMIDPSFFDQRDERGRHMADADNGDHAYLL